MFFFFALSQPFFPYPPLYHHARALFPAWLPWYISANQRHTSWPIAGPLKPPEAIEWSRERWWHDCVPGVLGNHVRPNRSAAERFGSVSVPIRISKGEGRCCPRPQIQRWFTIAREGEGGVRYPGSIAIVLRSLLWGFIQEVQKKKKNIFLSLCDNRMSHKSYMCKNYMCVIIYVCNNHIM